MSDFRALLYPFGFLAHIAFGARFFIQWLESEKQKRCVTPTLFWKLSLTGNVLLFSHCMIQLQYPMCIAQGINGVLAWRNTNLQVPKKVLFLLLSAVIFLTTFYFFLQGTWLYSAPQCSFWLHCLGIFGVFCHSLRFWVQWWQAEQNQTSNLTRAFWWLSLIGASLCSIYFYILSDWVNLLGPLTSLLPFSRNLWLMYRGAA